MNLSLHNNTSEKPIPPLKSRWGAFVVVLLSLGLVGIPVVVYGKVKTAECRENEIKAAFVYNFLKFVDWPKEKPGNPPAKAEGKKKVEPKITIGFIGKCAFDCANTTIKGKMVGDKKIATRHIAEKEVKDPKVFVQAMKDCQVLYISKEEKVDMKKMLPLVKGKPILTIGEEEGFLEAGGMINFILVKNKMGFEVNLDAAEEAKLMIRSKLLRLAKRVLQKKKKSKGKEAK